MAAAAVLPTGVAAEIDGAAALVVGVVHSFPGHPRPGAPAGPLCGARTAVEETGVLGVALYALLAARMGHRGAHAQARRHRTHGLRHGRLGTGQGGTWYLRPTVHDG